MGDTLILTVGEVAERWRCTGEHVQRLCRLGKLRAFRVGAGARSDWRIPRDAVDEFETQTANRSDEHRQKIVRKSGTIDYLA